MMSPIALTSMNAAEIVKALTEGTMRWIGLPDTVDTAVYISDTPPRGL